MRQSPRTAASGTSFLILQQDRRTPRASAPFPAFHFIQRRCFFIEIMVLFRRSQSWPVPLRHDLACHRLCPDSLLRLPKLGWRADSSFVITNHFPSVCCPEMRSRHHSAFGGTASRADVRICSCDRQSGQKPPASSSDTARRGLLLYFSPRAGLESLTHQHALGFAGNLSFPCHKALLDLFASEANV